MSREARAEASVAQKGSTPHQAAAGGLNHHDYGSVTGLLAGVTFGRIAGTAAFAIENVPRGWQCFRDGLYLRGRCRPHRPMGSQSSPSPQRRIGWFRGASQGPRIDRRSL